MSGCVEISLPSSLLLLRLSSSSPVMRTLQDVSADALPSETLMGKDSVATSPVLRSSMADRFGEKL